jgi:hypothetical protein
MAFRGVRNSWLMSARKLALGAIGLVRFFLGFPQRLFDALALADVLHGTEHPPGADPAGSVKKTPSSSM